MSRYSIALTLRLILGVAFVPATAAPQPLTEQDAHAIGVNAYLYLYPLVTMDLTRTQLTNVEPGKGLGSPPNSFANVATYPTADTRTVVRPNFDTLYASAWLYLTDESMVVAVPDTNALWPVARRPPY
jgi:hypothetical protein